MSLPRKCSGFFLKKLKYISLMFLYRLVTFNNDYIDNKIIFTNMSKTSEEASLVQTIYKHSRGYPICDSVVKRIILDSKINHAHAHEPLSSDVPEFTKIAAQYRDNCSVCLNPKNGSGESLLQCGHKYHTYCIQQWMKYCKNRLYPTTCPECRCSITEFR